MNKRKKTKIVIQEEIAVKGIFKKNARDVDKISKDKKEVQPFNFRVIRDKRSSNVFAHGE